MIQFSILLWTLTPLTLAVLPPTCHPPGGFSRPSTRLDPLFAKGPRTWPLRNDLDVECDSQFPGSRMVGFEDWDEVEILWSSKDIV